MAKLRITQIKSAIGSKPAQRSTLQALGLRRIRHEVVHDDSPAVRGMVNRVSHMVAVAEDESAEPKKATRTRRRTSTRSNESKATAKQDSETTDET